MRALLWLLVTYFLLSMIVLAASNIDLPAPLYGLSVLILPLLWLSRLLQPVLSTMGLWSEGGPGGWINYEGPTFGGLLLVAILAMVVSALLLLYAYKRGR